MFPLSESVKLAKLLKNSSLNQSTFPFSSPVLCFAKKANLMHLLVPQVQPGGQEVLD